jgi:hypothetical protein
MTVEPLVVLRTSDPLVVMFHPPSDLRNWRLPTVAVVRMG